LINHHSPREISFGLSSFFVKLAVTKIFFNPNRIEVPI
jgi:hypothetical protein